ncbi:gamma-butyrobetaine hydroxylase-like domain-containing protein [Massilia sp. DWR3-1-1]|uniref:gamma-butyrobetaine hydroxylase-like domain-containing protein n=1 Tax=Massilia sp. DWR3-1-1 TaxID=2804559 RepID=UPI003CFB771F
MSNPIPTDLTVHQQSRLLDIAFDDGAAFTLPFEYLRVYSPSAEVKGHGAGQEVLQLGKREVGMTALEPVGNYAVKPTFSDGHDSGLYTFAYLYKLGTEQGALWADYLRLLEEAGFAGDTGRAPGAAIAGAPTKAKSCG